MSVLIRTQAILEKVSGMPEDRVVNTFFNVSALGAPTDITNIQDNIADFYAAIDGVVFTSATLAGSYTLKSYNMDDAPPRAPIATSARSLTMTAGTGLPGEVAICLSYRQLPVSGGVAARDRGRIFIGPLATAVVGSLVQGDVRPTDAALVALRNAGKAFALACIADGVPWHVWSPTANQSSVIEEVSTDNAFDIQRRRGSDPTVRTRLTIA